MKFNGGREGKHYCSLLITNIPKLIQANNVWSKLDKSIQHSTNVANLVSFSLCFSASCIIIRLQAQLLALEKQTETKLIHHCNKRQSEK